MEVWQLLELDVYIFRLFHVRLRTVDFSYHRFRQTHILICYKLILIQYKSILRVD